MLQSRGGRVRAKFNPARMPLQCLLILNFTTAKNAENNTEVPKWEGGSKSAISRKKPALGPAFAVE